MTAQTGPSLASSPCSQLCLCYRTLVKRCEQMGYGQLWPCWLKSKSLALEFCSFSLLTNCKCFYRVNLEATCWEWQSSSQVPESPHWGQPSTYLECCLGPYTLELLIKPLMNMSLSLFLIITFNIISLHFLILNCIVSYLVLFGVILFCSSFSVCFLAVKPEGDPKMWLSASASISPPTQLLWTLTEPPCSASCHECWLPSAQSFPFSGVWVSDRCKHLWEVTCPL